MDSRIEALRRVPLFAELGDDELTHVAEAVNEVDVPAGGLLVQPGTAGSGMFFIADGTAVVETKHGAVQVDPEKLELAVAPMTVVARATPRLDAFRARHEIDADMPASFDEIVVEPGSRITIRGVLAVVRDASAAGERGYRDDIPTTVRLDAPVTVVRIW